MEFLPVVCLCLLSCSGTTSAAGNEPVKEVEVDEGSDAILPCSLSDKRDLEDVVFEWKRDDQKGVFKYDAGVIYNEGTLGPDEQFRGRVSHFEDKLKNGVASIKINKTSRADSGVYTCIFPNFQPRQTFNIRLVVGRVVVTVPDGSDVTLPCSLSTDITAELFDWKKDGQDVILYDATSHERTGQNFTGRVSHFKDELKNGNASIIIRKTKVADSGDYTCHFLRLQPRQIFHIRLFVGAAPEPNIKVQHTPYQAVLQCETYGSPRPTLEWRDGANNILNAEKPQFPDRGGRQYVSLRITVTKTDTYSCVATQKNISHRISAETSLFFQEPVKVVVEEDSEAILPCSLSDKQNLEDVVFDWKREDQKEVFFYDAGVIYNDGTHGPDEQFRGRVSHFEDELKNGVASIKINNTKWTDSGVYACIFPRFQPRQRFHIKLVVDQVLKDRSKDIEGAAEPIIKVLVASENRSLLQCKAHGVAPLTVEWQNSANNKLQAESSETSERGGQLYITVNITVTKADNYTCVATQKNISHQIVTTIPVPIHGPVTVEEDSDVTLPCSLRDKRNIENSVFDWKKDGQDVYLYNTDNHGQPGPQFTDRVSHFKDELKNGVASIKIRNTKWTDSGDYTCDFLRLQPRQIFHIRLVVAQVLRDRTGEKPGAAPKPYINTLAEAKDWRLLQCEAHGTPLPNLEWKDSTNKTLHAEKPQVLNRGGRPYNTLKITVSKTDNYSCVATQEEIGHQIVAEIPVIIQGQEPGPTPPEPGSSAGRIVGFVFLGIFLLVGGVSGGWYVKRLKKQNPKKNEQIREVEMHLSPSDPSASERPLKD